MNMVETLVQIYPWLKAGHVISFISWMAALLYLPRLFVYHVNIGTIGPETHTLFVTMEARLLRAIMTPAMLSTWIFGILLLLTPGTVDWTQLWPWLKMVAVVTLSVFHMWLARQRRLIEDGRCRVSSRQFRVINEIPTVLMIVIVIMVVVRPL